MNIPDLIRAVAAAKKKPIRQVEPIVRETIRQIAGAIARQEEVSLHGLGVIPPARQRERRYYNVNTKGFGTSLGWSIRVSAGTPILRALGKLGKRYATAGRSSRKI